MPSPREVFCWQLLAIVESFGRFVGLDLNVVVAFCRSQN